MTGHTLCLDVEADTLSGRPFAAGGVVIDAGRKVVSTIYRELHAHLHDPSPWVVENVYPVLAARRAVTPDCWCDVGQFYFHAWNWLQAWKGKAVCVVDCGSPVEGGFLRDVRQQVAATEYGSEFAGPYPVHEVATALYLGGHGDPDRLAFAGLRAGLDVPGVGPIAVHDPVSDAYASAVCWSIAVAPVVLAHAPAVPT